MQRQDIEAVIKSCGEKFFYKEKDYSGYLVRCGQKIPQKLDINADFMASNANFGTLLITNDFIPFISDEITDINNVVWRIDAVTPLYYRGEVQGFFLVLRTNQGIIK